MVIPLWNNHLYNKKVLLYVLHRECRPVYFVVIFRYFNGHRLNGCYKKHGPFGNLAIISQIKLRQTIDRRLFERIDRTGVFFCVFKPGVPQYVCNRRNVCAVTMDNDGE